MNYSQILEVATCTDPGMVRFAQRGLSIAADPANGLVVLADGMGGYNAGEVASGMATTVIIDRDAAASRQAPALRGRSADQRR